MPSDARPRPRAVSLAAMIAFAYVCAFVATLWVPFVVADASRRAPGALESGAYLELASVIDWKLASLLLFNAVNALICVWEIALWVYSENVQRLHEGYIKKFGDKVRGRARRQGHQRHLPAQPDQADGEAIGPEAGGPAARPFRGTRFRHQAPRLVLRSDSAP